MAVRPLPFTDGRIRAACAERPASIALYCALCAMAGDDSTVIVTQQSLSEFFGKSYGGTRKLLMVLRAHGVIEWEHSEFATRIFLAAAADDGTRQLNGEPFENHGHETPRQAVGWGPAAGSVQVVSPRINVRSASGKDTAAGLEAGPIIGSTSAPRRARASADLPQEGRAVDPQRARAWEQVPQAGRVFAPGRARLPGATNSVLAAAVSKAAADTRGAPGGRGEPSAPEPRHAAAAACVETGGRADSILGAQLLRQVGYAESDAERIAEAAPWDTIERNVAWCKRHRTYGTYWARFNADPSSRARWLAVVRTAIMNDYHAQREGRRADAQHFENQATRSAERVPEKLAEEAAAAAAARRQAEAERLAAAKQRREELNANAALEAEAERIVGAMDDSELSQLIDAHIAAKPEDSVFNRSERTRRRLARSIVCAQLISGQTQAA